MRAPVLFLLALLPGFVLHAQSSAGSKWIGEWGSFKEAKVGRTMRSEGQRLSVTTCLGETCQAVISTAILSGDHCDGAGELHIDSPTQATLQLRPPFPDPKNECTLTLTINEAGSERIITAKPKAGNCSFYCTPKCTFTRQFPFRSANPFVGDDIPGCYLARSKALDAVCSDKALSDLQKSWMSLSDSTNALNAKPPDAIKRRDEAQAKCSIAEDPGGCLRAFFHDDGVRLSAAKAKWQAGVSQPGEAGEAAGKAAAIAGVYSRSFNNATVQGDKYRSTDRLAVTTKDPAAIHFKADLNFANGHSCSVEGDAAYKKNGAFIFQSKENGEACVLEIVAGEKGVEFQDPLGGCQSYCGAHGTLNGARFLYSDRKK